MTRKEHALVTSNIGFRFNGPVNKKCIEIAQPTSILIQLTASVCCLPIGYPWTTYIAQYRKINVVIRTNLVWDLIMKQDILKTMQVDKHSAAVFYMYIVYTYRVKPPPQINFWVSGFECMRF